MMYHVFVAEDEPIIREGIRNHLENSETYVLSGEAEDGEMALSAILELKPDILITDIKMPFMDGLALSRAVKRAIPRAKIIILSGHDEFEYAKQAISIGVDEYLLKPITIHSLMSALDKIAEHIASEKNAVTAQSRDRILEREEKLHMRDGFFDELLIGTLDTSHALEMAERFEILLLARMYLVAEMELNYDEAEKDAAVRVRTVIDGLLENREDALWSMRGRDRVVLIAKGEEIAQLENSVYEIIISVRDELLRTLKIHSVTYIGTHTERISGIASSYKDAHSLMRRLPSQMDGAIIDYNDMEKGNSYYVAASLDEPVAGKLHYATEQDLSGIMQQLFGGIGDNNINSLLYGYYRITDLLIAAARVVNTSGGKAEDIFPELNNPAVLLNAASSAEELRRIAMDILQRLLEYKKDMHGNLKYGDIIARAKEYIYANYGDPALCLNTVAAYSGFSPNHFSTIFSQNTKETFIGFLTRVRMEQAKKLLMETSLASSEIAYKLGYNDTNYFRYLFRKHFNKSPRDFRSEAED